MEGTPQVRVRFAPSPTGYLHIGGARTALFNYLFARHHQGMFLLRIEDTDVVRSDPKMVEQILTSLTWIGLDWDEDPLYQSTRIDAHREACNHLLENGLAYSCFCTPEILEKKRAAAGREYRYDRTCLELSVDEVRHRMASGVPRAVRFRVPEGETVFEDVIRGRVSVRNSEIDDFIILRSDGSPVYQMSVVVDDHDMGITHVIRGDDHLSNTPKQILIYRAMGWPIPGFAHVPMILGSDKKRLSKRHGATSVEEYRSSGILPAAFMNYLALLGWSPGDDIEIMSVVEMIDRFRLDRVSKNPAVFDEAKLAWMNDRYLTQTDNESLIPFVVPGWIEAGFLSVEEADRKRDYCLAVIGLLKERSKRAGDFIEQGEPFFREPDRYEEKAVKKHWSKERVTERLRTITDRLARLEAWNTEALEQTIRTYADEEGVGGGKIIHPIRLALTGRGVSPGLFEVMVVLGRETVLRRLERAVAILERGSEPGSGGL